MASLALAAVLFAVPAEQARAHDVDTATRHAAALPLHDAVRAGDLDSVNHFIAEHQGDAKADVNRASGSGVTPLHWAADGGDVAIAAALLAAGADVSLTTGGGQTPLHWAANGGHAAVVATLLAADAEVNAKSDDGGTPLRFAAGGGHVSAVAELLAGGAEVDVKNDDGETPLHWAARNGRATVVATLLAAGAEVNAKNDDDETPLRFAVDGGHSTVAAALIAAGGHWGAVCADPAVVNLAGSSPPCVSVEVCEGLNQFYDAALSTCVPVAVCASSEVLYAGANDCHAPGGLRAAAKAGDLDLVNHFIAEHGADDANEASGSGVTPLHWAADGGDVAIVAALLAAGADVSLATGGGQTPLHWAANGGHAAVVATLLAAGAEVNAKSDDGGTPLRFAAGGGHVSAVAELLAAGAEVNAKNDDGETPLHWAARNGRAAVVVALLAAGAEVNAKNDDDETPLRFAGDGGHAAVVAALLAAGGYWGEAACASGLVVNFAGPSPPCVSVEVCKGLNQFFGAELSTCVPVAVCASPKVMYAGGNDCHAPDGLRAAVKAGDLDLVNHFIAEHQDDAEADVNRASGSGVTPLHWAADGGDVAIVAALLAAGAEVSLTTGGGQTPLHWAANRGHAGVVATLLAAGAEVNVKSDDGGTPLRFAAGGGHVSAVAELLAAGAEVDAKNDDGETPLHWAARNGRAGVVATLLAADAEVNVKNNDDERPLHLAVDGGHAEVVAALIAAGGYWGEAACVSGSVVNPAGSSPPCLCEPPTVGTPGSCASASAEVCGGLGQFYNAALSTCVPLVTCASLWVRNGQTNQCDCNTPHVTTHIGGCEVKATCEGNEVLYTGANDCHAAGGLHAAVEAGDLDLVNHFLASHRLNVNGQKQGNLFTPLHIAAYYGHVSIAAALLEAGANVSLKTRGGLTPLHRAAEAGRASVVALLISANADVNAEVSPGWTPLNSSRSSRDAEVVALIVDLLIAAGGHWGTVCRDGNVVNPDPAAGGISSDSPPHCVCPAPNVKTTSGACEPESTCDSPAVLNTGTNRCDCPASHHVGENGAEEPGICGVVSAEFCGNLKPGRFYAATLSACVPFVTCAAPSFLNPETNRCDCPEPYVGTNLGACEIVATCAAPLVLNAGTNRCDCPAPHVGTDGGECVAASAEVCGELNPPQFYDAALSACVPIVTSCDSDEEVVYPEGNDCHAESDYPLHAAARAGDLDLVNHFIFAHQASVNVKDNFGRLPLILAVETANASVVAALIAAGADVNVKDRNDLTPLYSAAARGYAAVVATLVALGVDVNLKTAFGSTPLHIAAYNGRVAAVAALIALDADVNAKTAPGAGPLNGATPLNWAASNKMTVVYPALIAAGGHWGEACAEPTSVNSAGPDPSCVSAAVCGGLNPPQFYDAALPTCVPYVECASGEVVYPDANDCHIRDHPLHAAVTMGDLDLVNHLLNDHATVNVDARRGLGFTPLHNAAQRDNISIVAALIAAGADVNARTIPGGTRPLGFAIAKGNVSIIALLIEKGANWGTVCVEPAVINLGWSGRSDPPCVSAEICEGLELSVPYFYDAALSTCAPAVTCAEGLVWHQEANDCHAESDYPLHAAARAGDLDLVNHFITAHRADVNRKNAAADTALHVAASNGRVSAAVALIAAGADVNATTALGVTPLAGAGANNMTVVYPALIAAGGHWGEACVNGNVVNPARSSPPCVSKEVCEELNQFYDAALVACVPFVECASGEVVYKDVNDCHAAGGLFAAVKAGDLDLVHHFITVHMADVNSKDRHQWALLHFAAGRGHIPVVTALISLGANVNVQNDSGQTPLHRAVNNDLVSVAATLIALGADVNARSFRAQGGQTPLTYTRGRSGPDVDALIALLIANGGHWGAVCRDGNVVNPTGDFPICLCESPKVKTDLGVCEVEAACDLPSVLNAGTNRCDCPAPGVGTDGADAPGVCACPAGHGVYEGACASCPSDRITAGGMCVIPSAVTAAANATLLAEVRKSEPDLAVVRRALDLKANPNITTSAGIPVLVVAATMLHADVVSVLITAGASPLVKVDGVSDATYNRNGFPRFIPEALMERGLLAPPADGGRRLAETFVRFGDGAGGRFDWHAASLGGERTGDLAFVLADALLQTVYLNSGATSGARPLDAVLQYLLDRGAGCGSEHFTDATNVPDSSACVPFAACDAPSVLNAGTNLCDCPALHDGLNGAEAPGVCACPSGWSLENGTCVPSPVVAAAANATLLAEVSKTWPESPDLAVVRRALDFGANPNITTSAGIPVLVVAATLLRAEVVSILITAGADPTVKVAGVEHRVYNPGAVSRFIPEALMERGIRILPSDKGRRLAETFIHFGDAAGDRFDWQAAALRGTTGESAFSLAESLRHFIFSVKNETPPLYLDAVFGYLLDRGVGCPSMNLYDTESIDSSLCARPVCPAVSGQTYACSACAGFSLRALDGGSCVSQCGENQVADATTWPDSQCRCAHEGEVGESGCPSEFDAALVSAALEPKPDLATIRALLDQGANPNVTSNGVPLLVVAATLLHADVVGVLITAGADPMVKVAAGRYDQVFNPRSVSIFIPEAIIQEGRDYILRATRMAETFIRFGEAAGDRFDWDAKSLTRTYLFDETLRGMEEEMTVGDWSFILAEDFHDRTLAFPHLFKGSKGSEQVEAVLRYLLDRGVVCLQKLQYGELGNIPCSQYARPTCSVTSGKTYSCATCAGFPLRDPLRDVDGDGGSCVSQCGFDKVADTTAWPDSQCRCAHEGDADAFGCPSEFDAALIREVRESSPNLVTIRALLDRRANPNVAVDGTPLLVVAATLLHADVVGVLVTAGADPLVKVAGIAHSVYNSSGASRSIPEGLLELGFHGRASVSLRMAETFARFGDAAGDSFWMNDARNRRLFGLLDGLRRRAAAEPDFEASHLRTMARYLLSRGASCPAANQYTSDPIPSDALCACPSGTGFLDGACVACPAGRILEGGECKIDASAANAMLAAEIRKLSPSLSTVRAALDAGASPDITVTAIVDNKVTKRPALIEAGRRGHGKIVSVLVTAGANVNARDPDDTRYSGSRDFGHHTAHRLSTPGFPGVANVPSWRAVRASLLYHFGDALDVRNAMFGDANYNWNLLIDGEGMLDALASSVRWHWSGDPDNVTILQEMADYAVLRGARCARGTDYHVNLAREVSRKERMRSMCNGSAAAQRLLAQAALVAEVEKAPGAANVATVRALLSGANAADPNAANSAGWPALILAARNGHAQIVSVLVTAGADVNATDPTFLSADAVQHAVQRLGDSTTLSSRQWSDSVLTRWSDVFYAFGGGLDVRNAASGDAAFDWNRKDGGGYRLLDLLAFAKDENTRLSASSSNLEIVHNMADYAIIRGAECGVVTADRTTRRICTGAPRIAGARASLVAEVKKAAGAAEVSVVLDLLEEESVHPNIEDSDGRPLLILAARNGHAEIVSVLVTAGADVNAADPVFRNFGAVHHAASPLGGANASGAAGPLALRASVLSYFGGGLDVRNAASPDAAAFDWNREGANGFRPLDLLADSLSRTADAADRIALQDMADYLIARGAECGVQAAGQNHPACRGTLKTLLDEVEKPAGAANVSVFSELLEAGAADPDHADSDGRSLLILAARNGHPRLVSVLAAAGADVNAADADFDDFGVAHHAAAPLSGASAGDAAGPRALRASVLFYFGGGLDARKAAGADFDWNREDANGRRPLDLLVLAASFKVGGGRRRHPSNVGLYDCPRRELRRRDDGPGEYYLRGPRQARDCWTR